MANLREQFEEWAESGNGSYTDAWAAWQAATEAAKAQEGDIPPPRYSYSADGKTVTLENYDDMMEGLRRYHAEAAKATCTAGEIDADVEMAKVKRDVEFYGIGFLVDGKRCGLDRITWFNRPGDTWLPPPPGYPTEAARQPAPVLSDEQIIEFADPHLADHAGYWKGHFKTTDVIAFARAILAATNRSQP